MALITKIDMIFGKFGDKNSKIITGELGKNIISKTTFPLSHNFISHRNSLTRSRTSRTGAVKFHEPEKRLAE